MGTHSHIAITHSDGSHHCQERTMDGFFLTGLMCDWVEVEMGEFKEIREP
jgi:hypothetical protein